MLYLEVSEELDTLLALVDEVVHEESEVVVAVEQLLALGRRIVRLDQTQVFIRVRQDVYDVRRAATTTTTHPSVIIHDTPVHSFKMNPLGRGKMAKRSQLVALTEL